jgi:hypothetical protein
MACASTCPTQDHESYGACLRSKGIQIGDLMNTKIQKAGSKNLDAYASARKYGIQPASTRPADVQRAIRASEATGKAYQA